MPICKQIQINDSCQLVIWNTTESLDELLRKVHLTPDELARLNSFGCLSRKMEFVSTRCLLQFCLGRQVQILNNEHGKPYLLHSNLNISVSHTKSYVGILLGKEYDIALDIECLSDRVHGIANRFLSKKELNCIDEKNKTLHLYQHWCAKECLIKLYGKKNVHLIKELKIKAFSSNESSFTGRICRADFSETYTFKYLQFDNHLLVYACKKSQ